MKWTKMSKKKPKYEQLFWFKHPETDELVHGYLNRRDSPDENPYIEIYRTHERFDVEDIEEWGLLPEKISDYTDEELILMIKIHVLFGIQSQYTGEAVVRLFKKLGKGE